MEEKTGYRALRPDAQAFDEVRIVTVPRYKESEMSGDEWRISARVEFYRKGQLKHISEPWRDVQTACNFLGYLYATACDDGHAWYAGEGGLCDQEGCSNAATVTYRLKKRYCREGHPTEARGEFRCFCDRHDRRGDCGLEDSDSNYEKLDQGPRGV